MTFHLTTAGGDVLARSPNVGTIAGTAVAAHRRGYPTFVTANGASVELINTDDVWRAESESSDEPEWLPMLLRILNDPGGNPA